MRALSSRGQRPGYQSDVGRPEAALLPQPWKSGLFARGEAGNKRKWLGKRWGCPRRSRASRAGDLGSCAQPRAVFATAVPSPSLKSLVSELNTFPTN